MIFPRILRFKMNSEKKKIITRIISTTVFSSVQLHTRQIKPLCLLQLEHGFMCVMSLGLTWRFWSVQFPETAKAKLPSVWCSDWVLVTVSGDKGLIMFIGLFVEVSPYTLHLYTYVYTPYTSALIYCECFKWISTEYSCIGTYKC